MIRAGYSLAKKSVAGFLTRLSIYSSAFREKTRKRRKISTAIAVIFLIVAILLIISKNYGKEENYSWNGAAGVLQEFCGNSAVEGLEGCDPAEENSSMCMQKSTECLLRKTGKRDMFGNCVSNCTCIYDDFKFSCVKGQCSAECNEDGSGCPTGRTCFTDGCVCVNACGDHILNFGENCSTCPLDCPNPNCPAKVEAAWDKKVYYLGDQVNFTVRLLDSEGNEMYYVGFYVDTFIDGGYLATEHFIVPPAKTFSREGFFINSGLAGSSANIVRTDLNNCRSITGIAKAEFKPLRNDS